MRQPARRSLGFGLLFAPAVWFMNQFIYPIKFLIIAILFLVVLASPMYELFRSVGDAVNFNTLEYKGVEYLAPNRQLLSDLVQNNRQAYAEDMTQLAQVHQEYGQDLNDKDPYNKLKASMTTLQEQPSLEARLAAIADARALNDHVGFMSNLILDPDIDSYSIMDTVVLQWPVMLDMISQAKRAVNQQDRTAIIGLKALLDSKYALTTGDFGLAYQYTKDAQLKNDLNKDFEAYSEAMTAYLSALDQTYVQADGTATSPEEIVAMGQTVIELGNALTGKASNKLSYLLKVRNANTTPKLVRAQTIAGIMLMVIAYLLAGFYWSVKSAVDSLDETAKRMADGDLTARLSLKTRDELKNLNVSFNSMAEAFGQLISTIRQEVNTVASASEELSATSLQMKQSAEKMTHVSSSTASLTSSIDLGMKTVAAAIEQSSANIHQVFNASEQVSESNLVVESAVEKMSSQMQSVAMASEEMSNSVSTVAAAIEQMNASLVEVSKNATQASRVSQTAQEKANVTIKIVDSLGNAAKQIENVVEMIKGIASQTNLLALNATIEAASAGEAGKGFAVVANEVKELAKQSAEGTEAIRKQIMEVQHNTKAAIEAIQDIATVIGEMNQINTTIAGAVEEQTSTVNEISRSISDTAMAAGSVSTNVNQSASMIHQVNTQVKESIQGVRLITDNLQQLTQGTNEIAKSATEASHSTSEMTQGIEAVQQSSSETSCGAEGVLQTSQELSRLASDLERLVGTFKL